MATREPGAGRRETDVHEGRDSDAHEGRGETAGRGHGTTDARRRQRDEFGGFNIGAAFFGWLVAVGIAVILTALLSAAGTAIGLSELSETDAESNAEEIGLAGGILLVIVLGLAYYAGGYVAGRLSRFDGARQGLGAWIFGLLITLALAAAGAIFGSEYNVLEQLNLPRVPVDEGTLASGAAITLGAILVVTLIAAIAGGKVGERYHRKVDRAGYTD